MISKRLTDRGSFRLTSPRFGPGLACCVLLLCTGCRHDFGRAQSLREPERSPRFQTTRTDRRSTETARLRAQNPNISHAHLSAQSTLPTAAQRGVGSRLNPRSARFARDLAAEYVGSNRVEAAIDALEQARRCQPQDASLIAALALLHQSTGHWQAATELFDDLVRRDGRNVVWRRNRARCLYHSGRYDAACDDFQLCQQFANGALQVAARSSRVPPAVRSGSALSMVDLVYYGDACLRTARTETARTVFDELAARHPHELQDVDLLRGICALKLQDDAAASDIFARALEHHPDDARIRDLMALCIPDDVGSRSLASHAPIRSECLAQLELVSLQFDH